MEAKALENRKQLTYKQYKFRQKIIPYLFLAPNLLIFTIFIIIPAIMGIYYSFTDAYLFSMNDLTFIGFTNYVKLFTEPEFMSAFWNTLKLVVVTVPLIFIFSLALAMLVIKPLKAKGLFRASYYWPVMISAIVVGTLWNFILGGSNGIFMNFWTWLGFDEFTPFLNENFAWWSVVFATIWSRTGYYMIIFMSALLSIPVSLYEAADVDGANGWQKFWGVTFPSLRAARVMVLILVVMEVFKTYPIVVNLTYEGGPSGATTFVVREIYETAFTFYEVGEASAMSVILLIFVTLITGFNFLINKGGTD